jgi:hypothetical protein
MNREMHTPGLGGDGTIVGLAACRASPPHSRGRFFVRPSSPACCRCSSRWVSLLDVCWPNMFPSRPGAAKAAALP